MRVIPFYYDDEDDLNANAYLLIDENNSCLIIDPSKEYDGLSNYIKKNNLSLKGILLTHGHIDHMRGVDKLINEFLVPFYIGFEEVNLLKDPYLNCSLMLSEPKTIKSEPITISDNEIIHFLKEDIICIHTPYHTEGSYCFYLKDSGLLFSGDSLFKSAIGRSDLPTGNSRLIHSSLKKILSLKDDVIVYPGHGGKTTIGQERKQHLFLSQ